jgi:hypothetical protein
MTNPLCVICGGKCCKTLGCGYSPDDFKEITFEADILMALYNHYLEEIK